MGQLPRHSEQEADSTIKQRAKLTVGPSSDSKRTVFYA